MEQQVNVEQLLQEKKEQLKIAIERHEFLEQLELRQDIAKLMKATANV